MEINHHNIYTPNKWKEYLNALINDDEGEEIHLNEIREKMIGFASDNMEELTQSFIQYYRANEFEFFEENYILMNPDDIYKELSKCQILVLTANKVEKAILHTNILFGTREKIKRIIRENSIYYIFKWGRYWICHVHQTETGAKDLGASVALREAVKYFRPNVIFSLGVSFGIDHKSQNIGDVIVSRRILPYDNNKLDNDSLKPDRSQDKMIDKWLNVRLINTNMFMDSVTYGDVLSGGSVLSSYSEKKKICLGYTTSDYIIGGEMEGNSLFQFTNTDGIPSVVIKGICDWGVIKNDLLSEEYLKSFSDEQPEIMRSEENFKTALQAYAMNCVCEKVKILLRDSQLFAVPKQYTEHVYKARHKKDITLIWYLLLHVYGYVVIWSIVNIFSNYSSSLQENLKNQSFVIELVATLMLLFVVCFATVFVVKRNIKLYDRKDKALKEKRKYIDLGNGYSEEEISS